MSNPNFDPVYSTWNIWRAGEMEQCLDDDLANIESDIAALESGKSDVSHTHSGYATQSDITTLEDALSNKANATHTHSEYSPLSHTHTGYATTSSLDALETEVDGKADANHTHTEYASASHTHDNYAAVNHNHDEDYASISHTHNNYATTTALSETNAAVSNKANISHNHNDIYYTESEIDSKLDSKSDSTHTHTGVYDASGAAATALTSANAYTDSKINALVGEGASTTLDTIGEISAAIEDNQDTLSALNTAITGKADATTLDSHTSNTTVHITANERSNWNSAKTHADTAHAPSNAEANQNAFSNIAVGDTTIAADMKTDTLTFIAGSNITLTPNETNDSVTIAATDTIYTLPSAGTSLGGVKTGGDVTISNGVITVNDDSHNHVITNIDGLQNALDSKATGSHNHNDVYYTESEVDSKLSSNLSSANAYADGLNTAMDTRMDDVEDKLDTIASGAEVNQNAFANVVVGSTTIAADAKSDNLTMAAGTGISISGDATNDKVTITNSGVRSVSTGGSNGTISVNTNGTSVNVAVKGLGSAAYTASTAYDAAGTAQTKADAALSSARTYADGIKNELLNGAGAAYDTLKELGDLIDDNSDAIDALETVAASKANASDLTSHVSNKSNPHSVTLSQLGVTATASELNKMDGVTATTAELNIMDGVTATTAEINYLDGVTSNVQTQLDGKAASSHGTHVTYSTTAPKANGTAAVGTATTVSRSDHVHPVQTTVSGNAGTATKLATARTISLTGDVTGSASFDGSANASITATVADDSHNHVISNVDGLQTALNGKADISHKHYPEGISTTGKDLNNYTDAGIYTFTDASAPANVPAGTNGWLVVIPWVEDSNTIKQLWFRHGTLNSNDFETYVRTKIGTGSWGSWSKYYTTSNPPTYAEVGASPAFTSTGGGVKISINTSDNQNLLDKINDLSTGVYTIYSQGGVSGNPKTVESWRLLVHKTSATIAWIVAFGSSGSIYTNYQNEADTFRGWKCIYEALDDGILWTGAYYMHSPNSTPQTVTPSKKLSECRTGWLLLWSDYDASTSTANDTDFCTTYIPKYNPSGGTWGGKAFYCDIPMYVGSDGTDLSTEQRCIKPIYVHDNCIKGSYQNNQGGRNDVVLRAVYEV